MNERPEQPPEGRLLAAATERSGLSIREASRRAGISYGRWRQITSGVQHVSPGEFAAVHAPARTLAKMAAVVGISPEQMETEGQRPDAAQAMRERREEPPPPSRAVPESDSSIYAEIDEIAAMLYTPVIRLRLAALAEQGDPRPSGETLFLGDDGDPLGAGGNIAGGLADGWDEGMRRGLDLDVAVRFTARAWAMMAGAEARRNDRATGRPGALSRGRCAHPARTETSPPFCVAKRTLRRLTSRGSISATLWQ